MASRDNDRRARMRMNREEQQTVAKTGAWGGSNSLTLSPPEGIEEWRPEEEGTYYMRVLPYEVTHAKNPDNIRKGRGHYRRLYAVHFDVGGSGEAVICLKETFGQTDAVCDRIKDLLSDYKANEDAIRAIRPKRFCLFAVIVWKAGEKPVLVPKLFAWSYYKFAELLEKKLKLGEPEDLDFAQPEGGKVLKVVVASENANLGGKSVDFLKTLSIEFIDGKSLTDLPDAVIDKIPNLDECFAVPTQEHIAALFNGDEEDAEVDTPPVKPKPGKAGKKPEPPPEDEWGATAPEPEAEGGAEPEAEAEEGTGWEDDPPPEKPKPGKAGKKPEPSAVKSKPGKTKPPPEDDVW